MSAESAIATCFLINLIVSNRFNKSLAQVCNGRAHRKSTVFEQTAGRSAVKIRQLTSGVGTLSVGDRIL